MKAFLICLAAVVAEKTHYQYYYFMLEKRRPFEKTRDFLNFFDENLIATAKLRRAARSCYYRSCKSAGTTACKTVKISTSFTTKNVQPRKLWRRRLLRKRIKTFRFCVCCKEVGFFFLFPLFLTIMRGSSSQQLNRKKRGVKWSHSFQKREGVSALIKCVVCVGRLVVVVTVISQRGCESWTEAKGGNEINAWDMCITSSL